MIKGNDNSVDPILYITVIILVLFGIVMVFSASFYGNVAERESPYYYLIRASLWAGGGVALMIIATFIPYTVYEKLALPIMVVSGILLIALYIPGVGFTVNNATRWIYIGPISIMPGELAKIAVVIFTAWYYTKYADMSEKFIRRFAIICAVMLALFLLIYKQPNLSTAVTIVLTMIVVMFVAGVKIRYLLILCVVGIAGVAILILANAGEHLNRIGVWIDPFSDALGEGFQTVQSLIALGTGGLFGVGLGNSVQKALWLPEAQTDFIFAIIGEEVGFIGCILILIVYLVLIWRCLLIVITSKTRFTMLLGSGITILLTLQVILNIGVVTNLVPPTGVILPFISYGGNAMLIFMFLMGVMQNIARGGRGLPFKIKKKKKLEAEAA